MKRFILSISLGICFLFAGLVLGDIPKQMSYQGVLSGSTGNPLADSTVNVQFRIYETPTGGSSKWIETQEVTTDELGRFSVILGLSFPIEDTVFNGIDRYLSIDVESNGEMPRIKLVSVGYSNRVSTVDGATGGIISGNTSIQSDLSVSGKIGSGGLAIAGGSLAPSESATSVSADLSTGDAFSSHINMATILGNNPVRLAFWNGTSAGQPTIGGQIAIIEGQRYSSGGGGYLAFQTRTIGDQAMLERVRIDSSGNVGIGTTTPAEKLEVAGTIKSSSGGFKFPDGTVQLTSITPVSSGWVDDGSIVRLENSFDWVGIGTATPNSLFQVAQFINFGNGTALGYQALFSNTEGSGNTANGDHALFSNTTGDGNTANGYQALYSNTTGSFNTAIGDGANVSAGNLTNATAIGALAVVAVSNALVLGGTGANAVNVGIGTTSPQYELDVAGDFKVTGNIIGSTPWTSFPFAAGYDNFVDVHGGGFQTVQYRKIGDMVYLRGNIHKADHVAVANGAILGTLPVGFRPPATVRFTPDPNGNSVDITSSGAVISYGPGTTADYQFIDGISFSTTP